MNQTEKNLVNVVNYLNDFFGVLSDGYNPTIIWLTIDPRNKGLETIFREDYSPYEFMVDEILKTKKLLNKDLKSVLDHYFGWSLDHLRFANNAEEIFKKEHNLDNLITLIDKVKNELLGYFNWWNPELIEYTVDTNDGSLAKYIFLNSRAGRAHLVFGNYIH